MLTMKTFKFTFFIRMNSGQEFKTGSMNITAKNYDDANKVTRYSKDVPFHHFSTVETINK